MQQDIILCSKQERNALNYKMICYSLADRAAGRKEIVYVAER